MTLGFLSKCLLQWFLIKTVTAQMPATKYIQMGNMAPARPTVSTIPGVPMPYPPNPTFSSLVNNYIPNYSNLPLPFNLPNVPPPMMQMSSPQMNLPLPFTNVPPVMPLSPPMNLAFPSPNFKPTPPSNLIDPTVMNNLAIALHLLILNNLLHPEQDTPKTHVPIDPPQTPPYPQNPPPPQEVTSPPYPTPQNYYPEPQDPAPYSPPNSKFLGSSGFVEPPLPSLMGAPVPPGSRNHHSLMSPYEVIASGPQPGKDVFAQYGPQNLKADFQSPYNSLVAYDNTSKDLFGMF
ncbi:uncharacterized protein LOC133532219 [Cydia pomonella]|uniref:uncharacterized protein LOC133532219 n=1 Tax=Cydia pomonella TaxID=82600 RepID=UPI002ADDB32C|nr:uncharacterized protein LOC133532219 [Cydia pomonella]